MECSASALKVPESYGNYGRSLTKLLLSFVYGKTMAIFPTFSTMLLGMAYGTFVLLIEQHKNELKQNIKKWDK